ncbi:P-loop containing nucleoside triphosphate hydrolase protein [Coccomyxa subellipsoidea C-169]|uniref:Eukaryotic translation initiation factor 5B n=1 Tax=Coccomyxa subellipsoidea (strain C-169) TaxID=574566 RepID=I0YM15_COCSC|nr:P-loop containing nucleoside triphosphate hydrolase protein [Coccomyxa subellipsoidea C-169]EIE19434.1 P-loop containing nucleoside triphosphate hydrolase protein [Coccomyxa subellipsoidea C-169]|eukprot:XP_005643978.1 P-loop containing nucleoside triphosphate hydrolase protein [Coccomyxa subellipsoidea C-169]
MREQILKNANLDEVGAAPTPTKERSAPKKVVYGRKKSAKRQDSGEAKTAEEMEQEAAAAKAALEAQRQQEEEQRRQEEEARKAEEEAAARAAAEAHVSESEEDTNWEDMDLDAVKLPGIEEEPSPAEVAKRAAADAAAEDSSSEDYSSSEVDSEEARENEQRDRLKKVQAEANARLKAAKEAGSRDVLRSPICCILGHVDTGKTKLLDNVRRTTVQEGEAGGITQQIGATYVPGDAICMRTEALRKGKEFELKLPGLLIIDTPGHESFTNLRSRGSGLCDIAILVVDIMHGMEQQTMESINLLKMRNTPFIVALNKVDRLFEWQAVKDAPIMEALERQKPHVKAQFEQRLQQSILNLNEQGLNVALYWKNPDKRKYVNIVPTSAISGEGIPDMLQLLVRLTQDMMSERLMFISELQCTVLEVKVVEGLGTTVDVVLVNGVLHEGDTIVLCGMNGPIVTNIRSLLTPHPLKELRVKGSYVHHKEIQAAQGVKLAAQNLETAVAGTQLHVLHKPEDLEGLKLLAMKDMEDIFKSVDRSGEGVCVQASTLGSLEALLEFLRSPAVKIPVSGIAIGPIHKKDVMRASVMLEKGRQKFAVILAFDVPVTKEARELAESLGVRIFTADIIYHLFDHGRGCLKRCGGGVQVKDAEQEAAKGDAVFPCILKILPTCVFNAKDPIVLGVDVVEGIAKVGTPICVPSQGGVDLGKIASLELNHKPVDTAKKGQSVAMKIEAQTTTEATRLYGRHFDFKDELVSRISRKSINLLKDHFREDMSKENWQLVMKLKKVFNID